MSLQACPRYGPVAPHTEAAGLLGGTIFGASLGVLEGGAGDFFGGTHSVLADRLGMSLGVRFGPGRGAQLVHNHALGTWPGGVDGVGLVVVLSAP